MITKVYLLNVPIESDYKHTLYFTNESTQNEYFQSKIVKSYTDFSYQRKDGFIRIPEHYDNLIGVNYVMYKNNNNKWYYAFITDMKYINDDTTYLYIKTDVIQTWLFNYDIKPSFVEREHVSDDTIGNHTIPENVERGEYTNMSSMKIGRISNELSLVVASTEAPSGEGTEIGGTFNGIYSGARYYKYDASAMTQVLQYLADNNKQEAVSAVFYAPSFILPSLGGGPISDTTECQTIEFFMEPIENLFNYQPRNNKLLTFPYCFYYATNGSGGTAIYNQELFTKNEDGNVEFKIFGALTPGCSIKLVPLNYKGTAVNVDEGLNLGKFPICNWATDMYTNWVTQNGVNVATSLVANSAQIIAGGALTTTGAGAGVGVSTAMTGVMGIANTLNQHYLASLIPPQTYGNINSGDVLTSMKENTFTIFKRGIKKEYGQIIDEFFDVYGYKVNRVKRPNKAHRGRWWFTKTIDVNIDGAIPMNDLQEIKNCYNNGITFWRNGSEIGDYNLENKISITSGAITDLD